MKRYIALIALSAALLCLSSCSKEENGKVLFKATIESPGQQGKTAIADDGTMTWRSGDQITVFYGLADDNMVGSSRLSTQSTGKTAEFTLVSDGGSEPTGGHYYTVYPASIAGSTYNIITLPSTQAYHAAEDGKVQFEAPMYAYSEDDRLAFKNLCGVVRLTLTTSKTISRIVVSANEPLCGEFSVDWSNGEPTLTATSTEGGTSVEFTCGNSGVNCTDGADFYLYLPVNEAGYTGMQFAFYAKDGSYCTKTLKSDQRFYVGRNTLNPLEFNLVFPPIGSKGGVFSVSATKQVWFSRGNLKYKLRDPIRWAFASHQYDYVGDDNSNISNSSYRYWIDLFGWSTGSKPTTHTTDPSAYCYVNGVFDEWGNNAIYNGGNTPNSGWRTLTIDEWNYLFNTRANSTNLGTDDARYAKGKVNNVHGVILFPDGYTHPTGITIPTGINSTGSTGWDNNSYTTVQWAAMEAAGAVFLPAAGRHEDWGGMWSVKKVGESGYYWSSTPINGDEARSIEFSNNNFLVTSSSLREWGLSVRLVKNYN